MKPRTNGGATSSRGVRIATSDWIMPLPVVISFGKNQEAHGTVLAHGPKAPFQIRLPGKPQKVELDPHHWVLSDKTSTK